MRATAELVFGRSSDDAAHPSVSEADFTRFLDKEVTPRFPDGLTVIDAHPLELIDAASAGGFNAIGLRIVPPAPTDPLVPVVGDEALIRELLARMKGLGIGGGSVSVAGQYNGNYAPGPEQQGISQLRND